MTELEQQQYARLQELTAIAKERYLAAGGDPRRCPSGRNGDDYMTEAERHEAIALTRQIFGVEIIGQEVHCQGRTWSLVTTAAKNQFSVDDPQKVNLELVEGQRRSSEGQ